MAGEYCPYSNNCSYRSCDIYNAAAEEAQTNGYKNAELILNKKRRGDTGRYWRPIDLAILFRTKLDLADRKRCAARTSLSVRFRNLTRQKKGRGELVKPREQTAEIRPPKTRVRNTQDDNIALMVMRQRLLRESRRR